MKIICFTGSRAEYYLQQSLFRALQSIENVEINLIVSGSVLVEASHQTLSDIQLDGIKVFKRIPILDNTDGFSEHTIQISHLLKEIDGAIEGCHFDAAIVYADRYESFAFALTCFHRDIPVVHLEAGDVTEGGTYDDSIRHCISKLSHLQCTSTSKGLNLVRSIGEEPWRNKQIGLLSYSSLKKIQYRDALAVSDSLGLLREEPVLLATMHPIPMDTRLTRLESTEFFEGLSLASELVKFNTVITAPNLDEGSSIVADVIHRTISKIKNCAYVESLGGYRYQSLLSLAREKCVIVAGNSSSVVKEAPYYGAHGLNVGRRQNGREKASSQHDVEANRHSIRDKIISLLHVKCAIGTNPYYSPDSALNAANFICEELSKRSRSELLLKRWNGNV